eukprot:5824555-Amphidinium_carterae.1
MSNVVRIHSSNFGNEISQSPTRESQLQSSLGRVYAPWGERTGLGCSVLHFVPPLPESMQ